MPVDVSVSVWVKLAWGDAERKEKGKRGSEGPRQLNAMGRSGLGAALARASPHPATL